MHWGIFSLELRFGAWISGCGRTPHRWERAPAMEGTGR
jgi:hypothetical protein